MSQSGQPGVLPLRPLTVGELIDTALTLLRVRAPLLLGLGLAAAAAEQAVLFPLRRLADVDIGYWPAGDRWPQWALLVVVGFACEAGIIAALGGPAAAAAPRALLGRTAGRGRASQGRTASPGRPGTASSGHTAARVFVVTTVAAAVCGLAMAPLFGGTTNALLLVLFGLLAAACWIWAYGLLGLVVPAVVIDRLGPFRALARSLVLSSRDIMRTLRVRVLAYFGWFLVRLAWGSGVLALIALVYTSPSTFVDNVLMAVVYLVVNALAYPVLACLDTVLHLEARMRTEGLDIALRRVLARGVDPYPTLARA